MHGRMPQDYHEPPPTDELSSFFIRAFFRMNRSRQYHFSGAPMNLGLSEVQQYVTVYGGVQDIEYFVDVIYEMDEVYIPVLKRKQKAVTPSSGAGKGESRPALPGARGR